MNITLEDTQEVISNKITRKYGDVFIRGNNGEYYNKTTISLVSSHTDNP